jgi:hypothetical protein
METLERSGREETGALILDTNKWCFAAGFIHNLMWYRWNFAPWVGA